MKLNLIFKPLRRRRGQLSVFSMLGLLTEKKERESRVDVFGFGPGRLRRNRNRNTFWLLGSLVIRLQLWLSLNHCPA